MGKYFIATNVIVCFWNSSETDVEYGSVQYITGKQQTVDSKKEEELFTILFITNTCRSEKREIIYTLENFKLKEN